MPGVLTEADTAPTGPRIDAENLVVSTADRGIRSSVVRLHAVAEDGVPFRAVSEAIARGLGVPAVETAPEDMGAQFAFLAGLAPVDNPTSSESTRALLGWQPEHPSLLEDLATDHYFARRPRRETGRSHPAHPRQSSLL